MSSGPLTGIKVLDASMAAVGPWAGALLGQMGADVVKLEPPQGDIIRHVMPEAGGISTTYQVMNVNKKNVLLNTKNPEEARIAEMLAQQADVFIQNFRPGVAERIGLGFDHLSALNPRLIYAAASGFGWTGPMAEVGATDPHTQAFVGSTSVNGAERDLFQRWRLFGHFDLTTSLCVVQGILAALLERVSTGRGAKVEVTMIEAGMALQRVRIAEHLAGGQPKPMGSGTTYLVPDQAFATQDRPVVVSATSRRQWSAFCRAIDRQDLAANPRFATNPDRVNNRDALIEILEGIFKTKPSLYWLRILRAAHVPCGVFSCFEDIRNHEQIRANSMLKTIQTEFATLTMGDVPWIFSHTPAQIVPSVAPGRYTDQVTGGHWAEGAVRQ